MTLDRVCDEIEQKGFSKGEKFEERSLWVGGWVGMCVLWCSKQESMGKYWLRTFFTF